MQHAEVKAKKDGGEPGFGDDIASALMWTKSQSLPLR